MSCFNLAKKFLPSKKAWKIFTSKLKAKAKKIQHSKPIKTITRRLNDFRSMIKARAFRHNKASLIFSHHHKQYQIYADELFSERIVELGETSNIVSEKKHMQRNMSIDEAWKAAVASAPRLRGVDERADEFICKFRESIKLEKERSIAEFEEMLARGV